MVKPLYTLASRLISTNGILVSSLRRIQGGFLAERNIKEAREYLEEMHKVLDEMEQSLRQPRDQQYNQNDRFVPLK